MSDEFTREINAVVLSDLRVAEPKNGPEMRAALEASLATLFKGHTIVIETDPDAPMQFSVRVS